MRALAVLMLVVVVALAGCGKKGQPMVPGPADEVIYPKQYPSR